MFTMYAPIPCNTNNNPINNCNNKLVNDYNKNPKNYYVVYYNILNNIQENNYTTYNKTNHIRPATVANGDKQLKLLN